jgi:nucleoside-diphosphate-sugar epimerase
MRKVLVIGAGGQIGTELILRLREKLGSENAIAADLKAECPASLKGGPYMSLDVLDREAVRKAVIDQNITEVYLLAALLSATAEKRPDFAWKLNMEGLFTVLDLAKEGHLKKIFWPSSIAVFGPTTPKEKTPQRTVMEPSTVYGISKQAGERWCEYYHEKFGVDVRSIRYPGLISYTTLPGGGTTDYAVDIFYQAKLGNKYSCFLEKDARLPMMFMEDAIRATLDLMEAPVEKVKIRSSYNLSGCDFTPEEISNEIKQHIPDFEIEYEPDYRQAIAESWPSSIDDSCARTDWGWKEKYNLEDLVSVMLNNVDVNLLTQH